MSETNQTEREWVSKQLLAMLSAWILNAANNVKSPFDIAEDFWNLVVARLESKSTANAELMDMNEKLVAKISELEAEIKTLKVGCCEGTGSA